MKRGLIIILINSSLAFSQLCFDFEENGLLHWYATRAMAWEADSTNLESGGLSLHHILDSESAGNDRISLKLDSLILDGSTSSWEFQVRHGYLPSSANSWAIFLVSNMNADGMHPGAAVSAWIIGVNYTGSDDRLKLFKQEEGEISVLFETDYNWEDEVGTENARIRIERDSAGYWKLAISDKKDPGEMTILAQGEDEFLPDPGYFGIYYEYSAKQDQKFWVDDLCISGRFQRDTLPACLQNLAVLNSNTLLLEFSENLGPDGLKTEDIRVDNGVGNPSGIKQLSGNSFQLDFLSPFPSGLSLAISIQNTSDLKNNKSGPLHGVFLFYQPLQYDIIFNEIMFDPSPAIGLAETEYLELYNRSGFEIDLSGWSLVTGTRKIIIPEGTVPSGSFADGGYMIICMQGEGNELAKAALVMELFTSSTVLPNTGDSLYLLDKYNKLIDWIVYSGDMHLDPYFADGGWSLERIDPDRQCGGKENWTSSQGMLGGTPGEQNSVYQGNPDRTPPEILNIVPVSETVLEIIFSEPLEGSGVRDPANYFVDRGIGNPICISANPPEFRRLRLVFEKRFLTGQDYYLSVKGPVNDCRGNSSSPGIRYRFAIPVKAFRSDILISEVLFDPLPGCVDFIELYNASENTFNLADLRMAGWDETGGGIYQVSEISEISRLFFPREYIVLTTDTRLMKDCYEIRDPACVTGMKKMPTMSDNKGRILLLDKWLNTIDEFEYNTQMHFPLLAVKEGVSLERLSFEYPANNPDNWHSASQSSGFSTPGFRNSQSEMAASQLEPITVEPEIFSPDNDGFEDFISISYYFTSTGNVLSISIFDPRGRIVRNITENHLAGNQGLFTWDGCDSSGKIARTGIYLIYIQVFDLNGRVRRFKKTCVLSGPNH